MTWICKAEWLAPTHVGAVVVTCDATGDTDKSAERHTSETGHPTVSGPNARQEASCPT